MTVRSVALAEALSEWLKDHKEITTEEAKEAYRTLSTIRRIGQEEARIRERDRDRAIYLVNQGMDGKEAFAQARAEREARRKNCKGYAAHPCGYVPQGILSAT